MLKVLTAFFLSLSLLLSGVTVAYATQTTGNNAQCSGASCGNGGGPKIVGNGSYTCNQGTGHNGEKFSTGGCTAGGTLIPLPPMEYEYFGQYGENLSTTTADQNKYENAQCEGAETTSGGASIFNCKHGQGRYWSLNMGQPNLSGHDSSLPFGAGDASDGSCPEPAGSDFWATNTLNKNDTNVSTNPYLWPNGTTVGTISSTSDIGMSTYGGTNGSYGTTFTAYNVFTNMGSTTFQSYANQVEQHCGDFNLYAFGREDNAVFGNESLEFTVFGNHNPPAYAQMKNFGASTGGPPYAATFGCSFNGTRCTRSTLLSSVDTTTQTYPTDASEKTAACNMFDAIFHKDGSAFPFIINNAFTTDDTVEDCASHVLGTQAEKYIVGGCTSSDVIYGTGNNIGNPCLQGLFGHTTSFSADNVATIINKCSATIADKPGEENMVEDYAPTPQNTALMQWNFRAHWGALWSCENDSYPNYMVSFAYFGNGVSGDENTYGPDFMEPNNRITPFPRHAFPAGGSGFCSANSFANYMGTGNHCTLNGINDPNICRNSTGTGAGSGNSCVVVTEFNHDYMQNSPDLTGWPGSSVYSGTSTVIDLGKTCIIYNNTAAGIQISSTSLTNFCSNTHASLTVAIALCNPTGAANAYFNTSGTGTIYNMPSGGQGVVCGSNSGKSVNQGGVVTHSQSLAPLLGEYLPPGDVFIGSQS